MLNVTREQIREIVQELDEINDLPADRRQRLEDNLLSDVLERAWPSLEAQGN